ncbi:hypothetical protein L7F22_035586 [Adiantum nelumboides]|nr:hypothetical protein [Adiantum nelumboides]
MDSLSKDLPLLDGDLPIIKVDDERSSESESERRYITKPEKFYDFSNHKPRRQERYRKKRTRKSRGKNMMVLKKPGEEPKPAYIATDLTKEEKQLLIATLKKYRDVFAWSYKDLKGVDPSICQHTIPLKSDAKPSRQRPYTYNETFARKIKEDIDKLKEAEFIYEIEHTDWVSPIVLVFKKNEKLRVCVNLKKVNAATIKDNYPLPITDHVIERVVGREAYSFLDGFSGYNQLAIKPEDQHKTAFATEWGIFAFRNTWDLAHWVFPRTTRSTRRRRAVIEESFEESDVFEKEQSEESQLGPVDSQDNAERRAKRKEMMRMAIDAHQEELLQKKARHDREKKHMKEAKSRLEQHQHYGNHKRCILAPRTLRRDSR